MRSSWTWNRQSSLPIFGGMRSERRIGQNGHQFIRAGDRSHWQRLTIRSSCSCDSPFDRWVATSLASPRRLLLWSPGNVQKIHGFAPCLKVCTEERSYSFSSADGSTVFFRHGDRGFGRRRDGAMCSCEGWPEIDREPDTARRPKTKSHEIAMHGGWPYEINGPLFSRPRRKADAGHPSEPRRGYDVMVLYLGKVASHRTRTGLGRFETHRSSAARQRKPSFRRPSAEAAPDLRKKARR